MLAPALGVELQTLRESHIAARGGGGVERLLLLLLLRAPSTYIHPVINNPSLFAAFDIFRGPKRPEPPEKLAPSNPLRSISTSHNNEASGSVADSSSAIKSPRSSRRRRSSAAATKPPENPSSGPSAAYASASSTASHSAPGAAAGAAGASTSGTSSSLAPIADVDEFGKTMTLSRSPSPAPGGGWSTPGLNDLSGRNSPRKEYGDISGLAAGTDVTWATAKARSQQVNGYASFSTKNSGFFLRHARTLSASLPTFNYSGRRNFSDKEKLGRGRMARYLQRLGQLRTFAATIARRFKVPLAILGAFLLTITLFYITRKLPYW